MTEALPKGVTCECGQYHEFGILVYAQWDEPFVHRCVCGRQNTIRRGQIIASTLSPNLRETRGNKGSREREELTPKCLIQSQLLSVLGLALQSQQLC